MGVHGVRGHARLPLVLATWMCSSMRVRTNARGTEKYAERMPRRGDTTPSSNGSTAAERQREREAEQVVICRRSVIQEKHACTHLFPSRHDKRNTQRRSLPRQALLMIRMATSLSISRGSCLHSLPSLPFPLPSLPLPPPLPPLPLPHLDPLRHDFLYKFGKSPKPNKNIPLYYY